MALRIRLPHGTHLPKVPDLQTTAFHISSRPSQSSIRLTLRRVYSSRRKVRILSCQVRFDTYFRRETTPSWKSDVQEVRAKP